MIGEHSDTSASHIAASFTVSAVTHTVQHTQHNTGHIDNSTYLTQFRLLRLAGIKRRSQGDPFRFIDKVSDLRQEFSFSARRIIVAAVYILIVVHWFACILWWTIRLQNYPAGKTNGQP